MGTLLSAGRNACEISSFQGVLGNGLWQHLAGEIYGRLTGFFARRASASATRHPCQTSLTTPLCRDFTTQKSFLGRPPATDPFGSIADELS